jgi:hypothetical protein
MFINALVNGRVVLIPVVRGTEIEWQDSTPKQPLVLSLGLGRCCPNLPFASIDSNAGHSLL